MSRLRLLLALSLQGFCRSLLEAVFPPKCLICGAFGSSEQSDDETATHALTQRIASCFCKFCREDLTAIASPLCSKCGLPFVSKEGEDHTCSECLVEEKYFRMARAFGVYDGSLLEAIHRFKYTKKTALSRPLSLLTRETFREFWGEKTIDLLIPVPLHVKRLRERGFNQALLLAKRWAKLEDIPLDAFALLRIRWTQPQTSLSRKERKRNIRGAFAVKEPESVSGERILLVDDVYTTGSTVNECARVLMNAGAEFVDVLTVARAV